MFRKYNHSFQESTAHCVFVVDYSPLTGLYLWLATFLMLLSVDHWENIMCDLHMFFTFLSIMYPNQSTNNFVGKCFTLMMAQQRAITEAAVGASHRLYILLHWLIVGLAWVWLCIFSIFLMLRPGLSGSAFVLKDTLERIYAGVRNRSE